MLQARGENLRSVLVLLFLTIAFFFLEYEDPQKYGLLFEFDRDAVFSGQIWRLLSFQFTQQGQGWFAFPAPVVLFFTLLLLYLMGSAIEEEWGTVRFLSLFVVSSFVTAVVAAILNVPLLGSYFVNFTLLFVYAAMYPMQTFFLFGVVPIRVRWLAYIAGALLFVAIGAGGFANIAVLAGAITGLAFYATGRIRFGTSRRLAAAQRREPEPQAVVEPEPFRADLSAVRNATRFGAMRKALDQRSGEHVDRLIAECEREVVAGVNICPPADFKPGAEDGYCIRCEGFPECAARSLRAQRSSMIDAPPAGATTEVAG
jgi:membrane associated rhomboid family serine protease